LARLLNNANTNKMTHTAINTTAPITTPVINSICPASSETGFPVDVTALAPVVDCAESEVVVIEVGDVLGVTAVDTAVEVTISDVVAVVAVVPVVAVTSEVLATEVSEILVVTVVSEVLVVLVVTVVNLESPNVNAPPETPGVQLQ
jgi:hypothetical protein